MDQDPFFRTLRAGGHRLTQARMAVIAALRKASAPLSAAEILASCLAAGARIDRATAYRELEFLASSGIALPVRLEGRSLRYEISDRGHHHHAVCLKCENIQEVKADAALEAAETRVAKRVGFTVLRHAFELFGLCKKCR
ncbi:MAG: Fur family transcriptional regulator [Patescibacteria group bacterium]|nr:MAG: Fur family transcriptional regulator [Patescibacteria group bacterium]